MKKCNKCLQEKNKTDFFKDKASSDGLYSICKPCKTKSTYAWRKANKATYNTNAKAWRKINPEKWYASEIKRRYGLTAEEYHKLEAAQNGKCAVCGKTQDKTKKRGRLYVDHCHKSKKIRGLLCAFCNSMLGYAKDNVAILQNAIKYLNP